MASASTSAPTCHWNPPRPPSPRISIDRRRLPDPVAPVQEPDETERAQILIIGQRRTCKAGEILFREGDAGDGLYVVVRGSVRISKQGATGEEALAVLESPAFFGEMALIDLRPGRGRHRQRGLRAVLHPAPGSPVSHRSPAPHRPEDPLCPLRSAGPAAAGDQRALHEHLHHCPVGGRQS
ncbi:MAG: cyclic nucleotide-binding domain-containing protein [Holophagaceae bacterium]|nr:cyclic nucleotide-binding domain-containing protein [Holophagaceae bacterium]